MTPRDLLDAWLLRQPMTPQTQATYRATLGQLEHYWTLRKASEGLPDEGMTLAECFHPERYGGFLAWYREQPNEKNGQPRAPGTINQRDSLMRCLWRYAKALRLIDTEAPSTGTRASDLSLPKLTVEQRPPTAWTAVEMQKILDACEMAPYRQGFDPRHWQALILALYDTGCRIRHILACYWGHWDDANEILSVPAYEDKEKKGIRRKVSPDCAKALRRLAHITHGKLFPYKRGLSTLRKDLRAILQHAGLPNEPHDLFHKIRRTHGTHVYATTGSIAIASESLNHSSVKLTRANYIDPTQAPDAFQVANLPLHQKGHASDAE